VFETQSLRWLEELAREIEAEFSDLPPFTPDLDPAARAVLEEVARRLGDNFPYFHPLYAGQMLKPPHPVARLAYALAMLINPNNHALDGGRASSAMEKEAVAELAAMFGWREHLGHLTGGGTMANLEALWVAGRLRPGETILASAQAHYTHRRIGEVLRLDLEEIPVDDRARLDLDALEARLRQGGVGTVVATLGTTGLGAVDPLPGILALRERHRFRLHVDAAYGGYFKLCEAELDGEARAAFAALPEADSIVVDPHKHGLQPYGCGCILHRDPAASALYRHSSPYTYFSSTELHLGEISLECSRAGASAVALWATQRLMPLVPGGELARGLAAGRAAALELHRRLAADSRFLSALAPELDILVWAPRGAALSAISRLSREHFERAAARGLHLALLELPASFARAWWREVEHDAPSVTLLRSCLMKPEHRAWLEPIWAILSSLPAS